MTYVLVAGVFGLLYLIARHVVSTIRDGGRSDERAKQAEKAAESVKKQAEEMLKERSVEDVARDLDDGRF